MTTGRDLVNVCIDLYNHHQPQWYSQQDPRCDPIDTRHADCSGGICWAMDANNAHHDWPGDDCSNSWLMSQEAHRLNLGITREKALVTPGAAFSIGADEGQTNVNRLGHVGLLVGDGHHTFEWRGRYAGLGIFDIESHYRIDYYFLLPGIDYSTPTPAPVPIPKQEQHPMGMIVLPNTDLTPKGRVATAVEDFKRNRVLLEDGARLGGDHAIDGAATEHWWAPGPENQIPGWSLVGIAPIIVPGQKYPSQIVVRYAWGDDNGGTYLANVKS
jgi:hypothetical protein